MKEKMSHAGYTQGDMSPHVEDYQKPHSDYAESGFTKTTEYIERQDAFQRKEAGELKKQAYKGRYS
jgi:hypothetical protein